MPLALSIDDFSSRYVEPAVEVLADMTWRELRRRRISRRTFLRMSSEERQAIVMAAARRYGKADDGRA